MNSLFPSSCTCYLGAWCATCGPVNMPEPEEEPVQILDAGTEIVLEISE